MRFIPGWLQRDKSARAVEGELLSLAELYRPVLLSVVLVVAVVISALMVIYASFEYRKRFNLQQNLVQQWDEYQVEWGQLLLEESALGANGRVEKIASSKLAMQAPKPEMIEVVAYER